MEIKFAFGDNNSFDFERKSFIRARERKECNLRDYFSNEPNDIGTYGEKLTIFELEFLKYKGYGGNIISNIYIPNMDGTTSEIDVLFITKKGIFVIESKNYSGWIFGSQNDKYWTVCNYSEKWKLYNPVLQNKGHINTIHQHLRGVPCFSLIAFSERCELKKINVSPDVYVFNRDEMFFIISDIFKKFPNVIDEKQIEYITEYLGQFCNADKNIKKSHIKDVRKYNEEK
ncbi:MAG: NERD domain-containing protein [Ruminococcus flavefaciens]|nr:NERD domain-containing protein [Ruminococcus flavefaciens]